MKNKEIYIQELSDYCGPIGEFKNKINKLIREYGKDATIMFDAGYNNVQVLIETKKKGKK